MNPPTLPISKIENPSYPASSIIPWTTRLVDVPIRVHMPPRMAAYDMGMRNFFTGSPAFAAHSLTIGMKITTIGVLFRNADIPAIVGMSLE